MDSVHLVRARDFDDAMTKALALGLRHEQEYLNVDGQRVRWRFKEVLTLDILPDELDGAEILSDPVPLGSGVVIPFDAVFDPKAESAPTQTR